MAILSTPRIASDILSAKLLSTHTWYGCVSVMRSANDTRGSSRSLPMQHLASRSSSQVVDCIQKILSSGHAFEAVDVDESMSVTA